MFVPVLLLTGTAKYLFTPLAMAVVFAMLASYFLSRTLVPTMVHRMLRGEAALYQSRRPRRKRAPSGPSIAASTICLRRCATGIWACWISPCGIARPVLLVFLGVSFGSFLLVRLIGEDFFPQVDAGQLRLHARVAPATRIEETAVMFDRVEQEIRDILPAGEIDGSPTTSAFPIPGTAWRRATFPTSRRPTARS